MIYKIGRGGTKFYSNNLIYLGMCFAKLIYFTYFIQCSIPVKEVIGYLLISLIQNPIFHDVLFSAVFARIRGQ